MSRSLASVLLLTGMLVAPVFTSSVRAQDASDPYARCAALGADPERLACFDETYARSAETRVEVERDRLETREGEFGLSAREREERQAQEEPAGAPLAESRESQEPEPGITAQIASVSEDGRRALLQLDNGQIWRETDGSTMRNRVRDGWNVTITRHWSGAYEMRFAERGGYLRVTRVR